MAEHSFRDTAGSQPEAASCDNLSEDTILDTKHRDSCCENKAWTMMRRSCERETCSPSKCKRPKVRLTHASASKRSGTQSATTTGGNPQLGQSPKERRTAQRDQLPPPAPETPKKNNEMDKEFATSGDQRVGEVLQSKMPACTTMETPPWFAKRCVHHPLLCLHEELLDFCAFMQPSTNELLTRKLWVRVIAASCHRLWPLCKVRVFGSFYTGLSLASGDVDVSVTGVACPPECAESLLAEDLLSEGHVGQLTFDSEGLRVQSEACGLNAVVVFNEVRRVESSRLVRKQLKKYPHMRPLIIFLKHLLLQRGLVAAPEGLSTHLVVVLTSLFLESRGQQSSGETCCEGTSLGHLLFDFLKHYGEIHHDVEYPFVEGLCKMGQELLSVSDSTRHGAEEPKVGPALFYVVSCAEKLRLHVSALRALFAHGFSCLGYLLKHPSPESSTLCPLFLDPQDPLILHRNSLAEAPRIERVEERLGEQTKNHSRVELLGRKGSHANGITVLRSDERSISYHEDADDSSNRRRVSAKRRQMVIQAAKRSMTVATAVPATGREDTDVDAGSSGYSSQKKGTGLTPDEDTGCERRSKVGRFTTPVLQMEEEQNQEQNQQEAEDKPQQAAKEEAEQEEEVCGRLTVAPPETEVRDVGRNADDDGVLALRTAKITNDEHVTEPGSRQLLVVVSAGMSSGKLGHGGSQGDIEVSEAKWSSLLEELKLSRTDQSVKGSAGGGGRAHRARRKAAILTPGPNADSRHSQCAAVF